MLTFFYRFDSLFVVGGSPTPTRFTTVDDYDDGDSDVDDDNDYDQYDNNDSLCHTVANSNLLRKRETKKNRHTRNERIKRVRLPIVSMFVTQLIS